MREGFYVGDVGGEEADEGEEGAPELGPVVCCADSSVVMLCEKVGLRMRTDSCP